MCSVLGPMCPVSRRMCPVFGRMCSVSRGMCPLWRAMCPVSGGAPWLGMGRGRKARFSPSAGLGQALRRTPARLTINGKGMGLGGREAGGVRLGMCSVGWVNVFSSWANVFIFWPDVFTLAGQVFSFGWGASPRFRRLRGAMTRGKWLVGGGEWLVTRAGVGLGGVGGRTGAGDGGCWQSHRCQQRNQCVRCWQCRQGWEGWRCRRGRGGQGHVLGECPKQHVVRRLGRISGIPRSQGARSLGYWAAWATRPESDARRYNYAEAVSC